MPNFLEYLKSIGGLFGPQSQSNQYPNGDWRTQGHTGIPQIPQQGSVQGPNLSSNMPGSPLVMNMTGGVNPNAFNDVPPDISQMNIGNDPYAGLRELYKPEHRYTDMMEQMLNQFPKREKPSLGRRIVSSMVAGGKNGLEGANAVLNEPYTNQLNDWKMKFDPLVQLANQERYNNANSRQFASTVIKDQADQEKLNETIRNHDLVNSINQQKVNISSERAKSYEELNTWKRTHPNYMQYAQPDGNMLLFDKNSNQILDTGIPSNKYDEKQLINLRGEISKEVAAIPRTTLGQSTTTTVDPNGMPPNQEKVLRYNRAQEIYNSKPDLAPFIHLANPGSNEFTIDPPEEHWYGHRGPTAEQYKSINDFINSQVPNAGAKTSSTQRSSVSSKGPVTPSGKPSGSVVPSSSSGGNKGTPPPIEQRQDGMQWTFPNGNIGKWNAKDKKWEIVKVVTK